MVSKFHLQAIANVVEYQAQNHGDFGLEGDGRPSGTVPILKDTNKKSDITSISLSDYTRREHCHAMIRTKANSAKKFMGTRAAMTIHKPKVQANQWSSGRIKLINGGDSIEAGWMAGEKGCINTECPGYVEVNEDFPLGETLDYSIIGKAPWVIYLIIEKQHDGNWGLSVVGTNGTVISLGYWPKTLFSTMVEAASQIEWGGEIYNPGASKPQPEMGSGKKATYTSHTSAYIFKVEVTNENYHIVQPYDIEKEADCKHYYTVFDKGNLIGAIGHLFFYGGTGWSFCPFC
ncbi:hypothetical protein RND81_13G171900 [Saponaria officinalis]|uniref:Neprosin PEP catalytic domain-containing protein n=1 Tax=Saponaria officinalis TaxID=3572 RepID=A0AAW1H0Y5_SAPOF